MQPIEQFDITSAQAVRAVREIIRRAILTFEALPDPQRHMRYQGQSWAGQWKGDLYADEQTRVRYVPSAHEIDQAYVALPWLQWLGHTHGSAAVKRLVNWCYGKSNTDQGRREKVSAKTIQNRIDRDVAAIIAKFFGANCDVRVVEEPWRETDFALEWRDRTGAWPTSGEIKIMTVYVHGKGLMRNGKPWNNGYDKAEKLMKACA